jgi:hypothetical protein
MPVAWGTLRQTRPTRPLCGLFPESVRVLVRRMLCRFPIAPAWTNLRRIGAAASLWDSPMILRACSEVQRSYFGPFRNYPCGQ